jgi:hypothetical protein
MLAPRHISFLVFLIFDVLSLTLRIKELGGGLGGFY